MKQPILFLLTYLCSVLNLSAEAICEIETQSIACVNERIIVNFNSDESYNNVIIDAYTVVNGTQQAAIVENISDNSAEIVFIQGGDSEVIVRFLDGNDLISICNQNVFVFDTEPIPALGALSNFVEDQVTCAALDLDFDMFVVCPECPITWTLDGEEIELDQQIIIDDPLQIIEANLQIEGLGSYTFCQQILKPDSTCYTEDCISIDIVDLDVVPSFELDEVNDIFCNGASLEFINTTLIDDDVIYVWEIQYDTLEWRIISEDLEFEFLFPGDYSVSLQYIISDDLKCISEVASMNISISDEPIIPITCSNNSCTDSIFTFGAPVDCEAFTWTIDENLGTILSSDSSNVTIQWESVDHYTETELYLELGACQNNVCGESKRDITLFPSHLIIDGTKGICKGSVEWYETDLIPNAFYTWEITMIDSISGIAPEIEMVSDNRVRIDYNSYVGTLNISVAVSIPSKECTIEGSINTTSIRISRNNNLCTGDLFKAFLLPNIDQEVTWTLSNLDIGYSNQQTISGNDDFFAFDLTTPGNYALQIEIPELGFTCDEDIPLTVLENPTVELVGPQFICPGDSATYTLAGLGGNDQVEWTIFQSNASTTLTGNEITILWEEGGAPYTLKVERSTEVEVGQVCGPESAIFEINTVTGDLIQVVGPEVVCYDGTATYQILELPGEYIWTIDPPYMGTIIEGDSTEIIRIQWHYAPDTPFATLSTEREICDSLYATSIDVYFEPYVPEIMAPDTVCFGTSGRVEIVDLFSYQEIYYYYNDSLIGENRDFWNIRFQDTGDVVIRIDVVHPNECPSISSVSKTVHVEPRLFFSLQPESIIKQCPKESFETVVVNSSYINEDAYYVWTLDGDTIIEGFGNPDVYSFLITNEMINTGASNLILGIQATGLCDGVALLPLEYICSEFVCLCLEDVSANVDYLTPLECNLASFGGTVDFSTVINPYWQINLIDTTIIIPINGPDDLVQDSFYFDEERTVAQVAIRGTCAGVIVEEICDIPQPIDTANIDTVYCEIFIDQLSENLYAPTYITEYICNEDLTYNITFSERNLVMSSPPYNSTITWNINGVAYEGISIVVENVEGGTELDIQMTQCSLDGTYCCSNRYTDTAREKFSPNIILPNGSCENDIWDFTLDVNSSEIVSALWDFGDGSGSTLIETSKGFMDTLAHDISVVVTDHLGCVATDETTVKSSPNEINGQIEYQSDPCASFVTLSYIENSESIIESYEWDIFNSPDTSMIEVTNSGDYMVTVTDINGCTNTASTEGIIVNESFVGGMRFKPENCGTATASVFASANYSYLWFVDGVEVSSSNSIFLANPGTYDVKVISTSEVSGEKCDSLSETITIFPLPEKPVIAQNRLICDPFIIELSLDNYTAAEWQFNNIPLGLDSLISASQNGSYTASVVDENQCTNTTNLQINEFNPPFEQLIDVCIEACREDLDSLSITIPGLNFSTSSWTWITVDSVGQEYEISNSSGLITPLTLTTEMYEYIQLQITLDDCKYRSERIPLDIQNCELPDPPVEIICEPIDSDHASCGLSIYKCLLSEINGGPKLYFEGSVTLPMDAVLCSPDSLTVSLNNGNIVITDLLFEEEDGKLMAFYSANIMISDPADYKENGTIIRFDFCDIDGELSHCYEYNLPYRSCGTDFNCLIDYQGVSSGANNTVNVDYCMNLSEVVQDDCTLTSYSVEAIISGDIAIKSIYTAEISGNFDDLVCISIPVDFDDFFGGEYNCIELMVEGDCPGIACSEYQCGIFGSPNMISSIIVAPETKDPSRNASKPYKQIKEFEVYPNPSTGVITFEFTKEVDYINRDTSSEIIITNTMGQIVKIIPTHKKQKVEVDLSSYLTGLYQASLKNNGSIVATKKFLIIR